MVRSMGLASVTALMIACGAPAIAQNAKSIPDHCAYLYAVSTVRTTNVVTGLVNSLDAYEEISLANDAVQLTRNLNCPIEPLERSVDCAVQEVKRTDGQQIDVLFVVDCVENNLGRKLPKLLRPEQ